MKRIILTILLCFISMSFHDVKIYKNNSFLQSKELNDSILYLALLHYDVKHPKAVLAQAKLESGNYTSRLYKKGNNFLGLYNSHKKQYFHFNHWTECIIAYKKMIEYKHKDGECYYKFLRRIGYAKSPDYVNRVKQIEKQIKYNDKRRVVVKSGNL